MSKAYGHLDDALPKISLRLWSWMPAELPHLVGFEKSAFVEQHDATLQRFFWSFRVGLVFELMGCISGERPAERISRSCVAGTA